MSRSATVDQLYRLRPADLNNRPRAVLITNVTYQGLEDLTPVLHFKDQNKRLLLTPEQWRTLVQLTGTSEPPNWIGQRLLLKPQRIDGELAIVLELPHPKHRGSSIPTPAEDNREHWRITLLTVGLLLLTSLVYTFLNPTALDVLLQIADSF